MSCQLNTTLLNTLSFSLCMSLSHTFIVESRSRSLPPFYIAMVKALFSPSFLNYLTDKARCLDRAPMVTPSIQHSVLLQSIAKRSLLTLPSGIVAGCNIFILFFYLLLTLTCSILVCTTSIPKYKYPLPGLAQRQATVSLSHVRFFSFLSSSDQSRNGVACCPLLGLFANLYVSPIIDS